jgi:hypothetical protein
LAVIRGIDVQEPEIVHRLDRRQKPIQLPPERECDPDRRAQKAVVLEVDALVLVLVDEGAEVPEVAS